MLNQWRTSIAAFALILSAAAFSGCIVGRITHLELAEHNVELTTDESRWAESGFRRGAVYETTRDFFLMNRGSYSYGPGLSIGKGEDEMRKMKYPDRRFYWTGPTTIEKYRANPEQWPEVMGLVDAGTRIRIVELWEHGNKAVSPCYRTDVKGVLLTGSHTGTKVDLRELERLHDVDRPDHSTVMSADPDPRFLRPVSENPSNDSRSN